MEIVNICTINFLNNTIKCVPQKSCCSSNSPNNFWNSWYIWFAVALLLLFLLISILVYLGNACKKKQQPLIRIPNLSKTPRKSNLISAISGPGGIIQPDIRCFKNQVKAESLSDASIIDQSTNESETKTFAEPLYPPYPPVEPIKIITGSVPSEGFRQTDSYTEIVLPPGYIDTNHYKS